MYNDCMNNYGDEVVLEKNKSVTFPDFTVEYLGEKDIEVLQYIDKYFTYKFYKIKSDGLETVLSWTSGTGSLSPLKFVVLGKKYSFQPWGVDYQNKSVVINKID